MNKRRFAFYGGSFDPVHNGHMTIAKTLVKLFRLDEFVFIPAFHAPHKSGLKPTPAFHRYAMLALATNSLSDISVSPMEIELPGRPFTVETLTRLLNEFDAAEIFFVMGADSWNDILTWREWEKVLTMTNHIVVTRPGYPIETEHVTPEIRERIVDLRGLTNEPAFDDSQALKIYLTDAVSVDISATAIRRGIRSGDDAISGNVPAEVAKYLEKYHIYS